MRSGDVYCRNQSLYITIRPNHRANQVLGHEEWLAVAITPTNTHYAIVEKSLLESEGYSVLLTDILKEEYTRWDV